MKEFALGTSVLILVHGCYKRAIVLEKSPKGNYLIQYLESKKTNWVSARLISPFVTTKRGALLDISIRMLQQRGVPMTAGDLIQQILKEELWTPTRAGKTPRLTLYGMLYNEATKAKYPRVKRIAGGLWVAI